MAERTNHSKQLSIKKAAPAALWAAGLGIVVLVVLLFTKLVAFIGIYTPTNAKAVNTAMLISLGVTIIGLAAYALMNPQRVREVLSGRQARHGSNAIVLLVAFLLILIIINVIVFQNPLQTDLTESKQNSLAPETINALNVLPGPVHAIGFFTSSYPKTDAQTLLNNVQGKSNGKFSYEFVDPSLNPVEAQQYKITQDGTIVLTLEGRQQSITTVNEQSFTTALVNLMNPGERTVYFLTGHGEHSTETTTEKSYSRVRTWLQSKNYSVKTLNLLAQNKVPDDALSIIIAGPTQPISADEVNLLKDYVAKGGSLVVLKDPDLTQKDNSSAPADPLVDYLAASWDIKIDNDLIVDPSTTQTIVALEYSYGTHSITDSLNNQGMGTFYPTACSLTLASKNQEIQTTALVKTIDRAWGETDFAALQNKQVAYDASTDISGPLTIAAAADNPSGKGKVVVFGDSDFASDAYVDQYGNADIFINSVDWAAGQQSLISLTAKQPITRTMAIPNSLTLYGLAFLFIIGIPGVFAIAGASFWLAGQMWFMNWSVTIRIIVSALIFGILGIVLDVVLKFTPTTQLITGILASFFGGAVYGLLVGALSSYIVRLRHG